MVQSFFFSLNPDKTYFIHFINKCTCTADIHITYKDKQMCTAIEKKLLGLFINNILSQKTHTEYIKSKLSSACSVWSVKPYVSLNTLKMIYHISRPIRRTFFPEKCDLNSTCVLCTEGKYYFQIYKYPYIYYTTSLSWNSEICLQIMRSGITACVRLTFLPRDLP